MIVSWWAFNQLRQKIGIVYGNLETTTGGNALKLYCAVRLDIRRKKPIERGDRHHRQRVHGQADDKAGEMATAILDRALLRVPADVRSYLRLAGLLSASDCALCDEEARPGAPAPARHPPTRLKS